MSRRVLQIAVGLFGVVFFVRFGIPLAVGGVYGGVFGQAWLPAGGSATPLLDSDLRFFAAMMLGIGILLFWIAWRIETQTALFRVLMAACLLGAILRLVSIAQVGEPSTPAWIALVLEFAYPIVGVPWQAAVARRAAPTR